MLLYTHQNSSDEQDGKIKNVGKDVDEPELPYPAGRV